MKESLTAAAVALSSASPSGPAEGASNPGADEVTQNQSLRTGLLPANLATREQTGDVLTASGHFPEPLGQVARRSLEVL